MYSAEITQMPLTSIQIQALVREMDYSMRRHKGLKQTNPTEYRNKVVAENQMLYNDMPSIFEMHITGKLDGTFFDMLALRRQIEKGEVTEDDAIIISPNSGTGPLNTTFVFTDRNVTAADANPNYAKVLIETDASVTASLPIFGVDKTFYSSSALPAFSWKTT